MRFLEVFAKRVPTKLVCLRFGGFMFEGLIIHAALQFNIETEFYRKLGVQEMRSKSRTRKAATDQLGGATGRSYV